MSSMRVLFTSTLDSEKRHFLSSKNFLFDEIPFLDFHLSDFSNTHIPNAQAWVFSSKRAVASILPVLSRLPKPEYIFCVGHKTAEALQGFASIYIPDQYNAKALSQLILQKKPASLVYFRGSIVAFDLQEALQPEGIRVESVIAYKTRLLPQSIDVEAYSHLVFMSPSALDAFSKHNRPLPKQHILVIGKTTHEKAKQLGFSHISQANHAQFDAIVHQLLTSI